MTQPLIVFDMDGVLVDVTESYRETIVQTVKHFTGLDVTREQIQDYKNQGGWNDDWKLSHHIITTAGTDIPFETAKDYFQSIFLGSDPSRDDASNPSRDREGAVPSPNGLILREQWVARPGVLEELGRHFQFAVFTGRPKADAELTLNRFAGGVIFDPLIGMHDVEHHKPHPEGLLRIVQANPDRKIYYIGDTVDDARCARAAEVPFIGIAAPSNPRYIDLVFLFQEEGAYAIIDDINFLQEVFAHENRYDPTRY
jgi:HAD superfamily phosphatase